MNKKLKKRLIIWGGVVLLLVVAIASFSGAEVDTTKIEPQTAELKFTETGIVRSQASVDVFALLPGELKSVNVKEGQNVKKGAVIAVIDSTELENQVKQLQTQSGNGSTTAQINAQNIVINQRQNEFALAADNEQKALALYQAGAIPEQDYKTVQAALEAAKSALDAAVAQLDIINSQSTSTQSQIDTLRKKIADCTIKSPIDGVVSALNVSNTNIVTQSVPVARVTAQGGQSEVEVFVSTKDISRVSVGESVSMTFEDRAGDIIIDGIVENIDSRAEGVQSALGTVEQKVKVIVSYDSTVLREGYAVDVDFVYYRAENKLIVPKAAVFEENGQDKVFVVKNGKARKILVEKGIQLRTGFVIESGLDEGDVVISDANGAGLKEGKRVRDARILSSSK